MRGSIRQRGPKVWQVRVSLGKDPATGRYPQRYVNGGKRDAQRASAELVAEIERGGHRQRGRHTVEELLERWMVHIESQVRAASTLVRYRSAIDVNITPRLGRVEIAKVDGATLDGFYGHLQRDGLNALTVRKSHSILSAAFSQATEAARTVATMLAAGGHDPVAHLGGGVILQPGEMPWAHARARLATWRPSRPK